MLLMMATVLLAGGMTSCGDDGNGEAAPPTTGVAPPDPTVELFPRDETEQEVEDAYLAYWAMLDRLGQNPDPDDPEIEQLATGTALEEVRSAVTEMRDLGHVVQPGPDYGHEVLEVTVAGDSADVRACTVDDSVITDSAGNPVDTSDAATVLLEASLQREASQWRVTAAHITESWPGATNCDGA
jgi:hypothetical protein